MPKLHCMLSVTQQQSQSETPFQLRGLLQLTSHVNVCNVMN